MLAVPHGAPDINAHKLSRGGSSRVGTLWKSQVFLFARESQRRQAQKEDFRAHGRQLIDRWLQTLIDDVNHVPLIGFFARLAHGRLLEAPLCNHRQ